MTDPLTHLRAASLREQAPPEANVPHSVMVSQIAAAVLAEREACAKVAQEISECGSTEGDTHPFTADIIAAKIRGRE
jgi:hypothetical protein